jgi:hypothetical protein
MERLPDTPPPPPPPNHHQLMICLVEITTQGNFCQGSMLEITIEQRVSQQRENQLCFFYIFTTSKRKKKDLKS